MHINLKPLKKILIQTLSDDEKNNFLYKTQRDIRSKNKFNTLSDQAI